MGGTAGPLRAKRPWVLGGLALLVILGGFGVWSGFFRGDHGFGEARLACRSGDPVLPNQATNNDTLGQTLSSYREAEAHAAKAAAQDERWVPLNNAYGVVVDAWATAAADLGSDWKSGDPVSLTDAQRNQLLSMQGLGTIAEDTIRSQCSVAES